MKKLFLPTVGLILLSASLALAADKVPLKTELPNVVILGTPVPIDVPNLEPKQKDWPEFMVPAGTVNLAKGLATKARGSNSAKANNGCKLTSPKPPPFPPSSFGISIRRNAFTATWWCRFPTIRRLPKT